MTTDNGGAASGAEKSQDRSHRVPGVQDPDSRGFAQEAEKLKTRAFRSLAEGFLYLLLIFLLLLGTYCISKEAGKFVETEFERYAGTAQDIVEDSADTAQEIAEDQNSIAEDQNSSGLIDLRDIARCGGTAIAVGRGGVIQVSTDGGNTWEDASSGTRHTLDAISFEGDCKAAVAVGRRGVILVSTDRGKTWDAPPQTHSRNSFNDVALSKDGKIAIAVGDRGIFRFSGDRGSSWESLNNVTRHDINGVALSSDGKTAVAVGDNNFIGIFTRKNGVWMPGKNWTDNEDNNWTKSGGNSRDDFEAVALGIDGKSAVVVGDDGAILFSADVTAGNGGWSRKTGKKDRDDFRDVAFAAATVVAVGRRGIIWSSDDGGENWSFRDSKQGNTLEAVALSSDGKTAVAVGRDGTVLISESRGRGWSFRNRETSNRLRAIAFDDRDRMAIVVGDNSIILGLEFPPSEIPSMEVLREEIVPKESDMGGQRVSPPEMAKTPVNGSIRLLGKPERDNLILIMTLTYFTRVGIIVVFLFMAQHLFGLFRYKLRLAAYYNARGDAIRLIRQGAFPQPRNIDELDQFMQALSPDTLEMGRPSRTIMNRMVQVMDRFMSEGRRRCGNCGCKVEKCTCKPAPAASADCNRQPNGHARPAPDPREER